MIKQTSIFLENSQGQLALITGILADAGIDLRALYIAESQNYGMLRLITDNCEKTVEVLKQNDFVASVSDVLALRLPDRPGSLSEALNVLNDNGIDISYMYSVFSRFEGVCFMIMKLSDAERSEKVLTENGFHIAEGSELGLA